MCKYALKLKRGILGIYPFFFVVVLKGVFTDDEEEMMNGVQQSKTRWGNPRYDSIGMIMITRKS